MARAGETSVTGRVRGIRLGSAAGVEIRVDWSLMVIFALVALSARGGLAAQHPGWSAPLAWAVGLVAATLLFASVLLHEMAHALVARAQGVTVDRITLFLFGGMAHMQGEPKSPKAEFLIAAVGPLTSAAIGVLALVAGAALTGIPDTDLPPAAFMARLSPAGVVLLWIGSINLILAVFNLVPGFPLDGGRVLRAILWRATGDLDRATMWAAGAGRGVAIALVAIGISMLFGVRVPFFGVGIGGIWLAMIGWFLYTAAFASQHHARLTAAVADVPVRRLMQPEPATIGAGASIESLVDRYFSRTDQRCYPVVDGDRLLGLVCLADARGVPRAEWATTSVQAIMTPAERLTTVGADDDAIDAVRKLARGEVDQVPVVHDGRLRGLVRRADVLRWVELYGT